MSVKLAQDGETYFVEPSPGQRLEVELEGFMPESVVREQYVPKSYFETEINRRVDAAKRNAKEGSTPDVEALRRQIDEKEVQPLRERLEGLKERGFRADFAEAAMKLGVDEEVADLVRLYVRERVKWDDEVGDYVAVGADGRPLLSSAPLKGRSHPYMTPADLLADIHKSGDRKAWFRGSSGSDRDRAPGRGGSVSMETFQKMTSVERTNLFRENPDAWRALMEETRREGERRLFESGA